MSDFSRRTIVRGAAWSVPVIAVASPVPAFAVSKRCRPVAECKQPGAGQNTKDYRIRTNCGPSDDSIVSVRVFLDESGTDFIAATDQGDGTWLAVGFKDSRAFRTVEITFESGEPLTELYTVAFPPC